jgi:hypothetical protein
LQRSRTKEGRREGYAAAAPLRWRAAGWGRTVATARCAAITRAGGRCKLDATHGSYCYQHAPETARERQRNASRGGKVGGNGRAGVSELTSIKRDVRRVIDAALAGEVERGIAAVAFQGFNALLKAVETERKVRETDELIERLEALEEAHTQRSRSWG